MNSQNRVTISRAAVADANALHSIRVAAAEALTSLAGNGYWSKVNVPATLLEYAAQGSLYKVVLEPAGTTIGTFRLLREKIGFYRSSWFADPAAPAAYLLHMAIGPEHQQKGYGRACMDLVHDLVRDQNIAAVRLDSYVGEAGAGGFYQKCGFERVHAGAIHGVDLEYWEKLVR